MRDLFLVLGGWLIILYSISYHHLILKYKLDLKMSIMVFVSINILILYFDTIPRYTKVDINFWLFFVVTLILSIGINAVYRLTYKWNTVWYIILMVLTLVSYRVYSSFIKGVYFMDEMGLGC